MYQYQKTNRYFAQVADDIKAIAEAELESLGATEISQTYRGLYFTATPDILYAVNYKSRLISRVLAPILTFDCHSDRYLYNTASKIEWMDFFTVDQTFAVFATVSNSVIRHSKYAALKLKDAIVDQFRDRIGRRPNIDTQQPDLWINLFINKDKAVVSIDTSGGSLHKRGYRKQSVEAPMIETLAAAIITHSGWDKQTPLYDPFCGSGTLLCEAFLHATNTPPGILRAKFGFEQLPDFQPSIWKKIKTAANQGIVNISTDLVSGSDISRDALTSAQVNCSMIDKNEIISISKQNIFDIESLENTTIVCNPPYGVRMDSDSNLELFYKQFGDFLKQRCNGSTAFVYFGDRSLIKHVRLKPSWKKPLSNGGLDGRLVKYEMY